MDKTAATNEAIRLKQYFPFRVVGVIENADGTFRAEARKTMAAFNREAKQGKQVFILRSK